MKLLVWGTGGIAKQFIENGYEGEIIGFIETKKSKKSFMDQVVYQSNDLPSAEQYDYIIVNQTVEEAAAQLEQIVCAAKHTAGYLNEFIEEVEDDAKTCCK